MGIKISEYRALTEQLSAANAKITELEKKLTSETNAKDAWYKQRCEFESQIEGVNQVLDSLPNPPPRKSKHEESWRQVELSLVARLAAWLATRS